MVSKADQALDERVYQALERQSVPWELTREYTPEPSLLCPRLKTIVNGRNRLRQRIGNQPYTMWLDSDIILPDNALYVLKRHLDDHWQLGAIGCYYGDKEREGKHVGMGAMMIRSFLAKHIPFYAKRPCECWHYCNSIRFEYGFEVCYDYSLRATHLKGEVPALENQPAPTIIRQIGDW